LVPEIVNSDTNVVEPDGVQIAILVAREIVGRVNPSYGPPFYVLL